MNTRALVAAVFAPHDAEDSEFRKRRFAFEDVDDLPILGFRQVVLGQKFFRYHRVTYSLMRLPSIQKSTFHPRCQGWLRWTDRDAASFRAHSAFDSRFRQCHAAIRSDSRHSGTPPGR